MPNDLAGLMAKYPRIGQVKTRLARQTNRKAAVRVYLSLLENVLKNTSPEESDRYRLGCFIEPSNMTEQFAKRYPSLAFYHPQQQGNLGQRMQDALRVLLHDEGANSALLIGADIPQLSRSHLRLAFEALNDHDLVIGPTDDGGYYLIGMKKVEPSAFKNIDWGTSSVLPQTLKAVDKSNLSCIQLETLSDLDTISDLEKFPEFDNPA